MRLKTLFFLLLNAAISCASFAQKFRPGYIDSLKQALKSMHEDTAKVNVQNAVANFITSTEPNKAVSYANEALNLARRLNFQSGIVDAQNYLGIIYYHLGNYDSSLKYCQEYLANSRRSNDKKSIARAFNNIGNVYMDKGMLDSALWFQKNSLTIEKELKNKKGEGDAYNNIGMIYQAKAQFDSALFFYLKDMKNAEETKDSFAIGDAFTNIGSMYFQQGLYDKAIENHKASLSIKLKLEDQQGIGYALNNMGNAYVMKGAYDNAIECYKQALKYLEAIGNKKGVISCIDNIGAVYFEQKKFADAGIYFLKSKKFAEEAGNKEGLANALINLGMAEAGMKHYGKGIDYIKQGLVVSREIGARDRIRDAYKCLSEVYTETKDFKNAFDAFTHYDAIKDTLLNEASTKNINELQVQYETEKKNNENALLKKDKLLIAARLAKQKVQNSALIVLIIFAFIIAALTFYFWKKRRNYLFQKQLNEVRKEALNAQMSDHFIGNTMDSINSFIENNEKEKASSYLILFSRLIRRVLENSFKKLITLKEDLMILEDYIHLEQLRFAPGKMQYQISVEDDIDTENTLVPPMVLQVLVENALKHAFDKTQGGKLTIKVVRQDHVIKCIVEDNGKGLASTISARTESFKRKSFGSDLAERIIKSSDDAARSSFNVYDLARLSNATSGTRVEFTIPFRLAF